MLLLGLCFISPSCRRGSCSSCGAEGMRSNSSPGLSAGAARLRMPLPGKASGLVQGRAGTRFPSPSGQAEAATECQRQRHGAGARGAGRAQRSGGESSRPWDWDTGMKRIPTAGAGPPAPALRDALTSTYPVLVPSRADVPCPPTATFPLCRGGWKGV